MITYLAADVPAGHFSPAPGSYTFTSPTTPGAGLLGDRLGFIISNVVGVITVVAGLAFIFYFILGAINWITSAGDTQKAVLARSQIINALIGLVIVVLANPILGLLSKLLGVPLTNPQTLIMQFL